MADKAGATAQQATGGSAAPNQRLTQLHVAYGNALYRGARLRRAGNDGSLRQSPRVGVWRQGCAGTIGGRLWPMGRQLHARRVAIDAGARGGLPQRRRGETRFARGRRRPSRRRDHLLVRRRVSRGAGSSWNVRSPCSNPAATTIWPFASDRTPASPRWPIWRLCHGLSARSIARFRSSTACRRGSRASTHVGTLAFGRMHAALFELMRGDHARAAPNAFELARLAREHDLPMWRAFGVFLEGWAAVAQRRARRAGSRTCAAASSCCANRTF